LRAGAEKIDLQFAEHAKKRANSGDFAEVRNPVAPKTWQGAVNPLHSIDFAIDRGA
jgi:hypothetical protein